MKTIKVIELFAGVGGFRLGLESASNNRVNFDVVWSNQWEPSTKTQHASEVYVHNFGEEGHSSEDIEAVIANKFNTIPDHDMLVGGFPCQDYSVAKTLSHSRGIQGKKGILWWSIYNIIKNKRKNAPRYLLLENVDRLLKSPVTRRGRDFAIMLASLADLGYIVEWRVINAADYGLPQRRRRVFILGYKDNTNAHKVIKKQTDISTWVGKQGPLARAFPHNFVVSVPTRFVIDGDVERISQKFSFHGPSLSPFHNSGIVIGREVYTFKTIPKFEGKPKVMADLILHDEKDVPKEYFVSNNNIKAWKYLKGGKKEKRQSKSGFEYQYSEGPVVFPDPLDKPSRTIVTGEGGSSPSRFKHVIKTKSGKLRRLTPLELERLNMFPGDHTRYMSNGRITPDARRAFLMGNALVVGVIEYIAKALTKHL